jgi:hypothetical protein
VRNDDKILFAKPKRKRLHEGGRRTVKDNIKMDRMTIAWAGVD